jgi:hypothetical protein
MSERLENGSRKLRGKSYEGKAMREELHAILAASEAITLYPITKSRPTALSSVALAACKETAQV